MNILLTRWRDNKLVTIAINFDMNELGFGKRFVKGKGEVSLPQLNFVPRYNMVTDGADKMDQLAAVKRTRIRQKKRWCLIFAYFLDASVVNAWLLMKNLHHNNSVFLFFEEMQLHPAYKFMIPLL